MENESLQPLEFAGHRRADGTRKHHAALNKRGCSAFRASIDYMVPAPAKPADLVALFDGRATIGAISHWRFGAAVPPLWAIELLAQKMRIKITPGLELTSALRLIRKPGNRGAKALAAWRERKARERDEKEKAAELAALRNESENR